MNPKPPYPTGYGSSGWHDLCPFLSLRGGEALPVKRWSYERRRETSHVSGLWMR